MNLNQVTLGVSSVPESIEFYKKLGLELIVHTHDGYARFLCPKGESTFSIHQSKVYSNSNSSMIYFECVNLESEVKRCIQNGLEFKEMPNDKAWLWKEAHLEDPDGNRLVLYHAGENRINPPWKLKK